MAAHCRFYTIRRSPHTTLFLRLIASAWVTAGDDHPYCRRLTVIINHHCHIYPHRHCLTIVLTIVVPPIVFVIVVVPVFPSASRPTPRLRSGRAGFAGFLCRPRFRLHPSTIITIIDHLSRLNKIIVIVIVRLSESLPSSSHRHRHRPYCHRLTVIVCHHI